MSDMIRVRVPLAEVTETYTIPKVDVEDEGRYFCRVSNLHGSKEVHVDVKMMGESMWGSVAKWLELSAYNAENIGSGLASRPLCRNIEQGFCSKFLSAIYFSCLVVTAFPNFRRKAI